MKKNICILGSIVLVALALFLLLPTDSLGQGPLTKKQENVYKEAIKNINSYFTKIDEKLTPPTYIKTKEPKYTLLDLDSDNIPELILQKNANTNVVVFYAAKILKYDPKTNKMVDVHPDDDLFWGLRSNIFYSKKEHKLISIYVSGGTGEHGADYVYFKNGKLVYDEIFSAGPFEDVPLLPEDADDIIWYDTSDLSAFEKLDNSTNNTSQSEIKLFINKKEVTDQKPIIENGRTLVPIRVISEKLGYLVEWDAETKTASISNQEKGKTILFTIGSKKTTILDASKLEDITLDVSPEIIKGSTYVPLKAMGDALGVKVDWDGSSRSIYVEEKTDNSTPAEKTKSNEDIIAEAKAKGQNVLSGTIKIVNRDEVLKMQNLTMETVVGRNWRDYNFPSDKAENRYVVLVLDKATKVKGQPSADPDLEVRDAPVGQLWSINYDYYDDNGKCRPVEKKWFYLKDKHVVLIAPPEKAGFSGGQNIDPPQGIYPTIVLIDQ